MRRWWRHRRWARSTTPGARLVARRGISFGFMYSPPRLTERQRLAARDGVRRAFHIDGTSGGTDAD